MQCLNGKSLEEALKHNKRIYLCGNLQKVNDIPYIKTEGFEMGVSEYKNFTSELAHSHQRNHEYNHVIQGELKVYIFDEHKEYSLSAGDTYVIEPNMPYITKAQPGTRVLFTKVPGGDDKLLQPELDEKALHWKKGWENAYETTD